jgi:uncharacterized protein (TIGR02421 family)
VDRQVPFLVVYRRPSRPDAGTGDLAKGHASYLTAATDHSLRKGVRDLAATVAETLAGVFGACLVIELWSAPADPESDRLPFRIVSGRQPVAGDYLARLSQELAKVRLAGKVTEVNRGRGRLAPPGLLPLLSPTEASALGVHLVGIEIGAVYQSADGTTEYPLVRKALQRELGRALGRTVFQFSREQTTFRPPTYHALGRRAVVKAVWEVDRALAGVSGSFDLLLLVSPANTEPAWSAFRRSRYDKEPVFRYRPLPFDPSALKRRLWSIRVDRVEDPTLEFLFGEQRVHLDRQIGMLMARGTTVFLHDSLALYGGADGDLVELAADVLDRVPPRRNGGGRTRYTGAKEFAAAADAELERYRAVAPDLTSRVELRDDVSTLMVSRGNLLVGRRMSFPAPRVEALIHHEVGTHAITHHNGSHQPLRQLETGLAGYEALQEGLAVLAEYLVGGLSLGRLRVIAARVIAAEHVAGGAGFIDTFRLLTEKAGLGKRAAFLMATRVHRSGGFVKDALYLRGLADVLDHLRGGNDPATLVSGKFALEHLPLVVELQRRKILHPPALRPRYLEFPEAHERLERCRRGLTVSALVEEARA